MAQVTFKLRELNELIENSESGVSLVSRCTKQLILTFFQLSNLQQFIKDHLYSTIAKYDPKLDAIILSYKNVTIQDVFTIKTDGKTKVCYSADIYTFKPKIGSILAGVVNKKSYDHVGCLVHKVFNIAIPRPSEEDQSSWIGRKLKIGQEVQFKVIDMEFNEDMPYIKGELIDQPGSFDNYCVQDMELDEEDNDKKDIDEGDESKNKSDEDASYTIVDYFLDKIYCEYRNKFSRVTQKIINHHKNTCSKSSSVGNLTVIFFCDFFNWSKLASDFEGAISGLKKSSASKTIDCCNPSVTDFEKVKNYQNLSKKKKKRKKDRVINRKKQNPSEDLSNNKKKHKSKRKNENDDDSYVKKKCIKLDDFKPNSKVTESQLVQNKKNKKHSRKNSKSQDVLNSKIMKQKKKSRKRKKKSK